MPIIFAIWIAFGLFSSIAGAHYTTKLVKKNPHYLEIKEERNEKKQSTDEKLLSKTKIHTVNVKNLPMYHCTKTK
jgi:hypothetical protein